MEIKRKFEMTTITSRRFFIHRSAAGGQTVCDQCGEAMLTARQAASFFGIEQRRVFRIIETGAIHFTETESSRLMICLTSLAAVLDSEP